MPQQFVRNLAFGCAKHPIFVLIVTLVLITIFTFFTFQLEIEPDVERLLPSSQSLDSVAYSSNYDRLALYVDAQNVETLQGVQRFSQLIEQLRSVLDAEVVMSPFSTATLLRKDGRLAVETMAPQGIVPQNPEDLKIFWNQLSQNPFSPGLFQSRNGEGLAASFLIPKAHDYLQTQALIEHVLDDFDDLAPLVTGSIPFSAETQKYLTHDASLLLTLAILTILVIFFLGFRSLPAMILPLVSVLIGTVVSLGVMGAFSWRLTMVGIVTPPLVLALGSSYGIHILSEYFRKSKDRPLDEKEAIAQAIGEVGGTILLASLTTVTGLLCLLGASLPHTRYFAIASAVGVAAAALSSLTVLPALMALGAPLLPGQFQHPRSFRGIRFLMRGAGFLIHKRGWALSLFILLLAGFVTLAPSVSFNTSPTTYFPEDSKALKDLRTYSQIMGGLDELTLTLKAPQGKPQYFLQADVLKKIHEFELELSHLAGVSHLTSWPSYLHFAYATVFPESNQNVFESKGLNLMMSRLLNAATTGVYANEDYSQIYLRLRVFNEMESRPIDEEDTRVILQQLRDLSSQSLSSEITISIDGMSRDFLKLSDAMQRDFFTSTLMALAVIGILCALGFKSLEFGFFALVPMVAGIASSFLLMVFCRIPLDMTTIMVSCVAVGVGVDDSIHLLLAFRRHPGSDGSDSVRAALVSLFRTGRPIVLTSVSIVAGLFWLAFADFQPVRYFGLLIVFTLASACLATILILPPLLAALPSSRRNRQSQGDSHV
ncbi:MAG: MMPL family transporter [Spirochaetales bacterium]|nr:MMPL family transporter [Spirochaetales bacterium]